MKRKMKKFNEGGKTYNKEDEGLFGGKINYREEDGRKYVAGKATPFDRNPSEQRYYSMDDVKGKLSGLFGGKKEDSSSKFDELESVGGAGRRPRTIEEQIGRKAEEKPTGIASGFKSDQPVFKRNDNEKSLPDVKKVIRKDKVASDDKKSLGDKSTPLPGKADDKDKKVTLLPGKAADKKPVGKDATPMKEEDDKPAKYEDDKAKIGSQGSFKFDSKPVTRTRAGTIVKSSDEPSALDIAAAKQKGAEKLKKQYKDNEAAFKRIGDAFSSKSPNRSYKSGGSVKSSASSRGDGCAVRGKTKGRIY